MRMRKAVRDTKLNLLWLLTGLMIMGFSNIAFISYARKEAWIQEAPMPTPRWGLSTSVVDGKIYAFGGASSGWHPVGYPQAVEMYDPETGEWTEKASMPSRRAFFSTSIVNGKIYAIGGWAGSLIRTVEEYDPARDTWTRRADLPSPRAEISTSAVNGRIYAIGGHDGAGHSTVFEYDPAKDRWTKKTHMPAPKVGHSTSVVAGKIYVIGGQPGWEDFIGSQSVFEYNPAADT
jgi:N-acetylneuraminic acid mutarotase